MSEQFMIERYTYEERRTDAFDISLALRHFWASGGVEFSGLPPTFGTSLSLFAGLTTGGVILTLKILALQ